MKRKGILLVVACILLSAAGTAQERETAILPVKAVVYYFHPSERCPVDQSIETATRQLVRSEFAEELKTGILKLEIINTEDPDNATVVSRFDINAQALYVIRLDEGKEVRKDLTEFAFSNCQSHPARFRSALTEEIRTALK